MPDMYALIPRACGPWDLGMHIRQNTHAHVTTIKLTPRSIVPYKLMYKFTN